MRVIVFAKGICLRCFIALAFFCIGIRSAEGSILSFCKYALTGAPYAFFKNIPNARLSKNEFRKVLEDDAEARRERKYKHRVSLNEKYRGEDEGKSEAVNALALQLGQPNLRVRYLRSAAEREPYRIYPYKGRYYDSDGVLVGLGRVKEGIMVMGLDGAMYFKPVELFYFSHASFFEGEPVGGSVQVDFHDGLPVYMDNQSGHYPDGSQGIFQIFAEFELNEVPLPRKASLVDPSNHLRKIPLDFDEYQKQRASAQPD